MTREEQNTILNQILGTKEFTDRFSKEINKGQDWLLNYELGDAKIPGKKERGTVYTETWDNELMPSIMQGLTGNLQYYPNAYKKAKDKGYGIKFKDDNEASGFAELLHLLHELSGETQSSYEVK